jgi:hypothetical protein
MGGWGGAFILFSAWLQEANWKIRKIARMIFQNFTGTLNDARIYWYGS